jgi:hypothetical protein
MNMLVFTCLAGMLLVTAEAQLLSGAKASLSPILLTTVHPLSLISLSYV